MINGGQVLATPSKTQCFTWNNEGNIFFGFNNILRNTTLILHSNAQPAHNIIHQFTVTISFSGELWAYEYRKEEAPLPAFE